jgi:hypothetical protein
VVYRGRLTVVPGRRGPELEVRIAVRNARADSVTLGQGEPGCDLPLRLRRVAGGRVAVWREEVWRLAEARRAAHGRPYGHACSLALERIPLAPGARDELGPRRYPVRAVRGDSLPAGWYVAGIELAVGGDTVHVPAGRVRLP